MLLERRVIAVMRYARDLLVRVGIGVSVGRAKQYAFAQVHHLSLIHIYPRRKSRRIMVGSVPVGGGAPISVQSMTNTLTANVPATLDVYKRQRLV